MKFCWTSSAATRQPLLKGEPDMGVLAAATCSHGDSCLCLPLCRLNTCYACSSALQALQLLRSHADEA